MSVLPSVCLSVYLSVCLPLRRSACKKHKTFFFCYVPFISAPESEKKFMACMLLFYAIYFMTLNIVNTIESNTMQLEKYFTFFSLNSVELETSSMLTFHVP